MKAMVFKMTVPAKPEHLAQVRTEVGAEAAAAGMSEPNVSDLKTVVTEACSNAILYAYGEGEEGSLDVMLIDEGNELKLIVRDFGAGIFPRSESNRPSLHMGLPLIGALSSSFCLSSTRGGGTELAVRMPMDSRIFFPS